MIRPRQPRVVLTKNKQEVRVGMAVVPMNFKPKQNGQYPPDNTIPFERWYMENYVDADATERIYLPIQWTALYCNNNYGKCHKTMLHIQAFLESLDPGKKYYTIVQYDDGILNNISKLDIKVMAMSGPRIDFALPLIAMPHSYAFNVKKDIFASFVGRITHPVRAEMFKQLKNKKDFQLLMDALPMKHYCELMARSKYALCPRGYGQTSFRIQEAIQYGAIPVYISDEFVFPYNMPTFVFGPTIAWEPGAFEYFKIDEWLKASEATIAESFYTTVIEKNKHLFTYQGCKQEILTHLRNENASA